MNWTIFLLTFLIILLFTGFMYITRRNKKYPCIMSTNKGYVIYNKQGRYLTEGGDWFDYSDHICCRYHSSLDKAISTFNALCVEPTFVRTSGNRVYGLETAEKIKKSINNISSLQELIDKDKEEGKDTEVLESILQREKQELFA